MCNSALMKEYAGTARMSRCNLPSESAIVLDQHQCPSWCSGMGKQWQHMLGFQGVPWIVIQIGIILSTDFASLQIHLGACKVNMRLCSRHNDA